MPTWMNQTSMPKRLGHTPSRLPTIHLSKSFLQSTGITFVIRIVLAPSQGERDISVNFSAVNRVLRIFSVLIKTR